MTNDRECATSDITTNPQIGIILHGYRPRNFLFVRQSPHRNGLLHAASQDFDQALLQFIHTVYQLWYTRCCIQPQML